MDRTPDDASPSKSIYRVTTMGKGTEHFLEIRRMEFNGLINKRIGEAIVWADDTTDAMTIRLQNVEAFE